MSRKLGYGILLCILFVTAACGQGLPPGDSGAIAMAPFIDETFGIRGLAPAGGLSEKAALLQQSVPGTLADLEAIIAQQTELTRSPEPIGTYSGRYLAWDLYEFETRVKEAGPWFYRVHMALAAGEEGYYNVVLLARPTDYAANKTRYLTAYEHALYALEPLQ